MAITPAEKCVIINADDFGFSPAITEGILRAHREGVVTSTTVGANMPLAEQAVHQLRSVPGLGVGVHLNCTQGPPLSEAGKTLLAGHDGVMNFTAAGIIKACIRHPKLVGAIEEEFDAQIRWLIGRGVRPTHLDSHRHSHAFGPIFLRVVKLARRYSIPFVRRSREKLPAGNWPQYPRTQRRTRSLLNCLGCVNYLLAKKLHATTGTWGVAHTGCIDAAWLRQAAACVPPGVTEIMTHPGLGGDTAGPATRLRESRPQELAALCDAEVKEAFRGSNVRLIHYGQISAAT